MLFIVYIVGFLITAAALTIYAGYEGDQYLDIGELTFRIVTMSIFWPLLVFIAIFFFPAVFLYKLGNDLKPKE